MLVNAFVRLMIGCLFYSLIFFLLASVHAGFANLLIAAVGATTGNLVWDTITASKNERGSGWWAVGNACLIVALLGSAFFLPWLPARFETIAFLTFGMSFMLGMLQRELGLMVIKEQ